jgi:hypothetical protein
VLRLLAASAEHWLATRLNNYLRDAGEYRAITRYLLDLGGQISYTPAAVTVTLDAPAPPRLARALALLLDEINTTRPAFLATGGPSPTGPPPRRPGFNNDQEPGSGGLSLTTRRSSRANSP